MIVINRMGATFIDTRRRGPAATLVSVARAF